MASSRSWTCTSSSKSTKALWSGVREDRPRGARPCVLALGGRGRLRACVEAGGLRRLPAGAAALRHRRIQAGRAATSPARRYRGEAPRRSLRGARCRRRRWRPPGGSSAAAGAWPPLTTRRSQLKLSTEGAQTPSASIPGDAHAGEPGPLALGTASHGADAGVDRHPAGDQRVAHRGAPGLHTQVDHGRHLDARIEEVERRAVALVVHRGDDRAAAGLHAIELDQALRGRGQHDPRQVVVAEDQRLLERAGWPPPAPWPGACRGRLPRTSGSQLSA